MTDHGDDLSLRHTVAVPPAERDDDLRAVRTADHTAGAGTGAAPVMRCTADDVLGGREWQCRLPDGHKGVCCD